MWRRAASSSLFLVLCLAFFHSGCGDEPTLCCGGEGCPQALPNDGDPCSLTGVSVGMSAPSCGYCPDKTRDADGRFEPSDLAYCRNGVFEVEGVGDVKCASSD